MTVTATNLTMGPGTLYVGVYGVSAEPADSAVNSAPAASAWTDAGGTDGGIKLMVDQKYAELTCDQIVDVVGRRLTSRDFSLETSLAEPTLANLQMAINGGTSSTGAGYSALDPLNATSATQPNYFPAIMDGFAPGNAFRRRVIVRKGLNTAKVESAYSKDKQTFIPVEIHAHYVSSGTTPFHVVDQTS
jgi:hypothetical protein